MDLYKELCAAVGAEHVLRDEPMNRHTTFRIGGPADFFVQPSSQTASGLLCRQERCSPGRRPRLMRHLLLGWSSRRGYRELWAER